MATAGAGAIVITGGLALSSPASAATASAQAAPAAAAAPMCTHPCSSPPGPGWKYIDNYFWASDCIDVGNRGISSGAWSRYQCDGGTWTNYDLWVN
jgi:hypothetical protein